MINDDGWCWSEAPFLFVCLKLHIPLFANLLYQFDFSIDFSLLMMIVAILLMMVEFPFVCVFETTNESVCLINSVYAPSTCICSFCYFTKYNLDLIITWWLWQYWWWWWSSPLFVCLKQLLLLIMSLCLFMLDQPPFAIFHNIIWPNWTYHLMLMVKFVCLLSTNESVSVYAQSSSRIKYQHTFADNWGQGGFLISASFLIHNTNINTSTKTKHIRWQLRRAYELSIYRDQIQFTSCWNSWKKDILTCPPFICFAPNYRYVNCYKMYAFARTLNSPKIL